MRLIDADALFYFLTDQLEKEVGFYSKGRNAGLNIARSALHDKTITPTISPPPNDPLTLDELREMDGEPVWVVQPGYKPRWALVRVTWTVTMLIFNDGKMAAAEFAMLEKGCKLYRRKPEEGTT